MIDAVELAAELVRAPSLSGDEAQAADVAEAAMRRLGYRDVWRDELGSVVGVVGPDGPQPGLLFDGHLDVVAPVGEWTVDPFGGVIEGGRLYGRGSTDMKGGLAAAICGVASIARDLPAPVAVSATVLEETVEGVALARVLDRLAPAAVVICEPSTLSVRIGQRGRAELLLTAHGVPAHAAFPERGRNAIALAAEAVRVLAALPPPHDPVLGEGILVVTDVVSDPYPAVSLLPASVRMRYDRRTLLGEGAEGIAADLLAALRGIDAAAFAVEVSTGAVRAYTGATVDARRFLPAWCLDRDHPLVAAVVTAVENAGRDPDVGVWPFCTNGSESAGVRGLPTVGLGPGDPAVAHTADESIAVDAVRAAARIYADLAVTYASEARP